jgi:GH43 family beta-xylosidase
MGSRGTFTNPVLDPGPDPWVTFRDGFYYFISSGRGRLSISKTRSVADLRNAEKKIE